VEQQVIETAPRQWLKSLELGHLNRSLAERIITSKYGNSLRWRALREKRNT
jgi:hypothetical protein